MGTCVVFFFFKQKTAYEMRISDWSSDVCSSDLFEADCQPVLLWRTIGDEFLTAAAWFIDKSYAAQQVAFLHRVEQVGDEQLCIVALVLAGPQQPQVYIGVAGGDRKSVV